MSEWDIWSLFKFNSHYFYIIQTGVFLDCPNEFTVDARSVSPNAQGKVKAIVTSPSGQRNDTLVKNNGDGTYNVLYTPFEQGIG